MPNHKHALVLALAVASAALPAAASAREDEDVVAGDVESTATVFAADGSSSRSSCAPARAAASRRPGASASP